MKNLGTSVMMAVACLLAPFGAMAADLVVPRGETVVVSESVVYDTVTVSGTLRIESTGKLKATNFNLGPNAGDAALVEVLGSAGHSLYVTDKMTIGGAEGGCGLVRAMNTAQNNTGWNNVRVLSIVNLTVAAGAASTGEFLDIVELGAGTLDMQEFKNNSQIRARVRVKDGRIGNTQGYWKTFFSGKFQLEAYDADSTIRFGASYSLNQMGDDLIVKSFGRDFVVVGAANPGNSEQVLKVGKGVVWEGVRDIVLKGYGNTAGGDGASGRLTATASDALPYGAGTGILRLEGKENFLGLDAGITIHLNGLDDASRVADRWCGTVRAGAPAKVIFGAGDVDGVLNGWIDAKVAVEKSGTGTLTVERESKAGTITVKAGTLAVNAPLAVEALNVEAGAVLRIDGQTIRAAKPGKIEGEVQLLNGAQFVSEYEVAADVREANGTYGNRMEKTGAGTLIVENPASMHPSLAVKEGAVAFSGAGYGVDLFKFRLVDLSWYETGRFFSLGEIAIADLDGKVVSKGIGQASGGTLPGQLAPGKAIFSDDWMWHKASNTSWGEVALFDLLFYSTGDVKLESFGDGKDVSVNGVPVDAGKIVCAYYRGSVRFIARGMVIMVR